MEPTGVGTRNLSRMPFWLRAPSCATAPLGNQPGFASALSWLQASFILEHGAVQSREGWRGQMPKSGLSLARTSSKMVAAASPMASILRSCQSALFRWSHKITP